MPTTKVPSSGVDYPRLTGAALPSYYGMADTQTLEGYASSVGSSIEIPDADSSAISAKDVSGSTLWTVSIATASAAVVGDITNWVQFWMNTDATLLYVIVLDTGTTNDTWHIITIDVAGTIGDVGSSQPSSDFSTITTWPNAGCTPDGSGGFKIFSIDQFLVIDNTGTITTQPTSLYTNAEATAGNNVFETGNDNILTLITVSQTTRNASVIVSNKTDVAQVYFPIEAIKAVPITSAKMMRWRDYNTPWDTTGGPLSGQFKYTDAQIDAFVDEVLTYAGLSL
jgi:hypothetical protein